MESTRIWLADTLVAEAASYARGMAAWLRADPGECSLVLGDLVAWLRGTGAPGALPSRQRRLARTFLMEALKQDGLLEARRRRDDVGTLFSTYFGIESVPHLPRNRLEP